MSGIREQIQMFEASPPTMAAEMDASPADDIVDDDDETTVQEVLVYSAEPMVDEQLPDKGAPKRSSAECWELLRSRLLENVRKKRAYGNRLYTAVLELQAMEREVEDKKSCEPTPPHDSANGAAKKEVHWTVEGACRSVLVSKNNTACDIISKHTSCGMSFIYVPSRQNRTTTEKRIEKCRAIEQKVCITVDWNGVNIVLVPTVMIPLHVLLFVISPQPETVMLVFDGSISEKTGQVTLGGGTLLELCISFETEAEAGRLKKSIAMICKLKMQSMTARERSVLCKGTRVFSELLTLKCTSGMTYARRRRAFSAIEAINRIVETSNSPTNAPTLRKQSMVRSALSKLGL